MRSVVHSSSACAAITITINRGGLLSEFAAMMSLAGLAAGSRVDVARTFDGTEVLPLLRETGNLKLVQRALNHADLKTTTRYAHVLDDEVAEAMERVAELRKTTRTTVRKMS